MTRRQQVLRLGMLAGLAMLAGTWLLSPPAPSEPAEVTPSAAVAPAAITPAPAATAAYLPPLPPRESRMQDVLPALQARADAGDGIAACRMSVELMRCQIIGRTFAKQLPRLERQLARQQAKPDPAAVSAIEARLTQLRTAQSSCAGLPDGLADRAQHYLRAAALAGEPLSRLRYAAGAGFDDADGFDYLVTPAFDQWRREAEGMMQRSLVEGRPEAALILAAAYSGDQGLLPGLVADDLFKAQAHARLMERVFGESLAAFPFPLPRSAADAADAAAAEALAAQWHQDYFGERQYDLMALMLANGTPPWRDQPKTGSDSDPCPGPEAGDRG